MKTDTTEKGLETLIVGGMTAQGLWIAGHPTDYDLGYAINLHQLRAFVEATQPPLVEAPRLSPRIAGLAGLERD